MSACMLCSCKIENVDQVVSVLKVLWETVLTGLFPEVPRHLLNDHLICDTCYDSITRLKTFKIRCQSVENEIVTFSKRQNSPVVNLKDVRQDAGQDLQENARLCRTCLRKVDDRNWEPFDQTSAHYLNLTTFHINPNLDLVPNPIICHYCTEYLQRLTKMRQKCLQLVSTNKKPAVPPISSLAESSVKTELTEQKQKISHLSTEVVEPKVLPVMTSTETTEEGTESLVDMTEFYVDIGDITQTYNDNNPSTVSADLDARIEESMVVDGGVKMFQCMFCRYQAARKGHLKVHIECRHQLATVQFECALCNYKAPRKIQLSRHIRMRHRHGSREMLSCQQCNFQTPIIEYLRKHAITHQRDPFACPHCDFRSKWKSNLKKHIRCRHEKEIKASKCPHCEYSTFNRRSYRRHLMTKHTREEDKYRCEMCDFKTSNKEYLKKHFKLKHDDTLAVYTCEVCGKYKTKSKAQMLRHKEVVHEKKEELEGNVYECSKCPFKTVRKKLIAYHLRMHDAKRIYKCDECSYDTKFRGNLRTHILYKHRNVFVKCPQCEYKAKWKESLRKHIENKHSDKKKVVYECAQCKNYKVFHERTLVRHIKAKHSPFSQTFKCDVCDFQTNLIEYLRKHVSYMHKNTSLFHCRHCEFNTKGKHVLKKHLRVRHEVDDMEENRDYDRVKVEGKKADTAAGLDFKFVGLEERREEAKEFEEVLVKVEQAE